MKQIDLHSREELQNIRKEALKISDEVQNPNWKRAYMSLADSADYVDAIIARTQINIKPE